MLFEVVEAELLGFAAGFGVGDEDSGGEGGDEVVAGFGKAGSWLGVLFFKGRKGQDAVFVDAFDPWLFQSVVVDAAGRANDDWLGAAKEEVEAFLFHGGVEAADDGNVGVAEAAGEIVRAKNGVAGALIGAEEAQ